MSVDKYKVEGAFEATVLYYLCESKGFATHFMPHIVESLFTSPHAELVVDLIIKHFKKHGRAIGGIGAASNLIAQLYNKGKITISDKRGAIEYLDMLPLYLACDEDDCFTQFAELLKEWKHYLATKMAIELQMNRKPITEVVKLIAEADSIMVKKESVATVASADDFSTWKELIKRSGMLDRMPTGVDIWDTYLDGGLPRKTLGIIIAPSGGGKSLCLSQMCASALLRGEDSIYVSLEVDDAQVASRVFAPIAGIPITFLVKKTDAAEPYMMKTFKRTGIKPGRLYVEEFPQGILVSECLTRLDKKFEEEKFRPSCFFFDYLDRFGGGNVRGQKSYESGADITQSIRNYISHHNAWGWSACQSKRFASKSAYKEAGLDDVADSMHKVRISDVVINLLINKDGPNGDEIASRISKHRSGKSGQQSAYIPVDYSYGVVFPSKDFKLMPLWSLGTDSNFSELVNEIESEKEKEEELASKVVRRKKV